MTKKDDHQELSDHPTEAEVKKWYKHHFGTDIAGAMVNPDGSFEVILSEETRLSGGKIRFGKGGSEIHNDPCTTTGEGLIIPIVSPYASSSPGKDDENLPFYHRPLEDIFTDMLNQGPTTGFGGVNRDIVINPGHDSRLLNSIGELFDPPGELHISPNLAGPAPYILTIDGEGGGYCPFCNAFNPSALRKLKCVECNVWFLSPTVAFQWASASLLEINNQPKKKE